MFSFLASLLAAIPAIEKLIAAIAKAIIEAEKKKNKDAFKKRLEDAILKGDQTGLDSGTLSGHLGTRVVKRTEDKS